jgi:hypothetical protein
MPWLHLIFDAWEDYRKKREQDAAEREVVERREAMKAFENSEGGDAGIDFGEEHGKHKKKDKKHKGWHKK